MGGCGRRVEGHTKLKIERLWWCACGSGRNWRQSAVAVAVAMAMAVAHPVPSQHVRDHIFTVVNHYVKGGRRLAAHHNAVLRPAAAARGGLGRRDGSNTLAVERRVLARAAGGDRRRRTRRARGAAGGGEQGAVDRDRGDHGPDAGGGEPAGQEVAVAPLHGGSMGKAKPAVGSCVPVPKACFSSPCSWPKSPTSSDQWCHFSKTFTDQ